MLLLLLRSVTAENVQNREEKRREGSLQKFLLSGWPSYAAPKWR